MSFFLPEREALNSISLERQCLSAKNKLLQAVCLQEAVRGQPRDSTAEGEAVSSPQHPGHLPAAVGSRRAHTGNLGVPPSAAVGCRVGKPESWPVLN